MNTTDFAATTAALNAAAANPHLSDREKHLIGLAITATRGCSYCTGGRIRKAIESGIPREAVIAAVDLAAAVNAGVTIRTALLGAEQSGVLCNDGACIGASPASPS